MAKKSKKLEQYLKYRPELELCRHCGKPNDSRIPVEQCDGVLIAKPRPEHIGNGYAFYGADCAACDSAVDEKLATERVIDRLQERRKHFRDGKNRGFKRIR